MGSWRKYNLLSLFVQGDLNFGLIFSFFERLGLQFQAAPAASRRSQENFQLVLRGGKKEIPHSKLIPCVQASFCLHRSVFSNHHDDTAHLDLPACHGPIRYEPSSEKTEGPRDRR